MRDLTLAILMCACSGCVARHQAKSVPVKPGPAYDDNACRTPHSPSAIRPDGRQWWHYRWTQVPRRADARVMARDCLCGPGESPPVGCRDRFDFDGDDDVDLADFAVIQAADEWGPVWSRAPPP